MSIAADGFINGKREITRPTHRGLAERAVKGLHDAAFVELHRHVTEPLKILDLGAGTGAWAARLLACGYDVTCLDQSEECFSLNVPFVKADLNEDFSGALSGSYRVVTAIEVIEHVENPTHFLRQSRKVLAPGGILLLTTPNIECVAGRLRFLLDGHFRMFGRDARLNDATHVSPIQSYMFEKMTSAAELRVLSHKTSEAESSTSGYLSRVLSLLVSPFIRGLKTGDNHIFVLTGI